MANTISRRNFLKQSSIAGLTAAVVPAATAFASTSSTKSRVVIVNDPAVLNAGKVDEAKMIAMFDQAAMALSGKTDIGPAYEALFPNGVTATTKILMKRNDISGTGAVNTAVTNAFKKALGKMLGGTFPAANIEIFCPPTMGTSALSRIEAATYLINCPVCWMHSTDYGVTLSLKNTMTYLLASGERADTKYHSANKEWLHKVSLDARIKSKQVLSLMDAIVGNHISGPGGSSRFSACTIIMGKDVVAVDYNAIRLMEKQSGVSTPRITTGDNQLKAAETAGLGTCTPSNMEVIQLAPPFSTGIIREHNPLVKQLDVRVVESESSYQFILPAGTVQYSEMVVFNARGSTVWKSQAINAGTIVWDKQSTMGGRVPPGMYTYRIKQSDRQVRGILMVTR